jgi:hypothetical protein
MGSRLKSNTGLDYFNPSVILLTSTRARVTYESLTTNGVTKIIVDCSRNIIIDEDSYTTFSSVSNNEGSSTNSGIIGTPIKIGNLEVAQFDFPDEMNLSDAKAACAELGNGWRLPTKDELNTLYENQDQIGGFTHNCYARDHWSSTEGGNFGGAWHQYFRNGAQYTGFADNVLHVRAVKTLNPVKEPVKELVKKSIAKPPSAKPVVIGKPIKIGNLEIAEFDFPEKMTKDDASTACSKLGKGWRLPTKDELNMLYQNRSKIGGDVSKTYWSSTEIGLSSFGTYDAWLQFFGNGNQFTNSKTYETNIRAVRDLETIDPITKPNNLSIIGKAIKIGNLEVAQFDFADDMTLDEAKAACAKLGKGWRLPSNAELKILYRNKTKIGGFLDRVYLSSTSKDDTGIWVQGFSNGSVGQDYVGKNYKYSVRAVRSF